MKGARCVGRFIYVPSRLFSLGFPRNTSRVALMMTKMGIVLLLRALSL